MKTTIANRLFAPVLAGACLFLAVSCDKPAATHSTSDKPRAAKIRDTRATTHHSAHDRTSGFQWQVGDTSSYALDLSFGFGETSQDAAGLTFRGTYHLAVLAAENDSVTLAATVSGSDIRLGGEASPVFEELADETPALIVLTGSGALQQVSFPPQVPEEDRQFLLAIHSREFQMRGGSKSWSARETDTCNGTTYQSTYTATAASTAVKTRRIVTAAEGPGQKIRESEFTGKAGRCWLDSLKGREITTISHDGKTMGEAVVSVTMELDKSATLPDAIQRLLASMPKPGEFTPRPTEAAIGRIPAVERIRIAALRAKFESVAFEVPYEALAEASTSGSHSDTLPALHDLRDLLMVRPELAQRVADMLKSGVNPQLSALLTHALELANTEASQKTLASILANPGDYSPTTLVQAIVAAGGLGTLKDPAIGDALDTLQSSYGASPNEYSISDAALFSLSRLAPGNPALQEPLVAVLKPLLAGTDDESRRNAVLALGNARIFNDELFQLAGNLLTAGTPQTREAALAYFELAPDLGTAQIAAIAGLLRDAIGPVQLQAVATLAASHLANANPQSLAALQSIAHDKSATDDVRNAARLALNSATAAN